MACNFRNEEAQQSYEILSKLIKVSDTAESIVSANNGYGMKSDRKGNPSQLFIDILDVVGDEELTHVLKANIYKNTFVNEPSITEFSNMTEEQRTVDAKKYNLVSMAHAIYRDAIYIGTRNTPANRNARKVKGVSNQIYSEHAVQTAAIINDRYGQKVAYPFGNIVRILLTKEQLVEFVKVQVQKEHARIKDNTIKNGEKRERNIGTQTVIDFKEENDYSDYDLIDTVTKSNVNENFINYANYVEHDIKKLSQRLSNLKTKKRLTPTRKESKKLIREIVRIKQEIVRLRKNFEELTGPFLTTPETMVEAIKRMAEADMARVDKLLHPSPDTWGNRPAPNKDDLLEAKDILEWYQLLGDFESDTNHPFFKDNTTYDDKEIIKILKKVSDNAKIMNNSLVNIIKEQTHKRLTSHRNYDKLELDVSMADLFDAEVNDIDWASAFALNPNFVYDFGKLAQGDNFISQLMSELFVETLAKKDAFARNITARIDELLERGVKKEAGGNFLAFYQKDKDGNLTPYLINPLSTIWYNFRYTVSRVTGEDINDTNQKKYKLIKSKADFVDITKITEIKKEFAGKRGVTFVSDKESLAYSRELRKRLGNVEYKKMVNEQIKKIDEYFIHFDSIIDNATIREQELGAVIGEPNTLSNEEKIKIIKFELANNPFNVSLADENGVVTREIYGNKFSETVNTWYIEYVPKQNDTHGFANEDFNVIRENELLSDFWEVMSESLLYINGVLAATGEQQVSFNSLLDMNKSIREKVVAQKFGVQWFKYAYKELVESTKRFITSGNKEFVEKKASETEVDTSRIRSLRGLISRKKSKDMRFVNRVLNIKSPSNDMIIELNEKLDLKSFLSDILSKEEHTKLIELANSRVTRTVTYGEIQNAVYKNAQSEIMQEQSLDLGRTVKYYLNQAARVDAAHETIPVLRIMKNLYTDLETEQGDSRIKANMRINRWYDRVVRGYFGVKGIPINWQILSKKDKAQAVKLKKLLDFVTRERELSKRKNIEEGVSEQEAIRKQIEELGKPMNIAFIFSLFQSFMITWAMAYNFKSGAFNFFYGVYQNNYFDTLGEYWTPGNSEKAFQFVLGKGRKNLYKAATRVGLGEVMHWERHAKQIEIAQLFMNQVGIIQDVRNEKQKASDKMGKKDYSLKGRLNPYYMSITAVEWRNQSTTILSVLMDVQIENLHTHKMVQVFDGNQFLIYDNVNHEGIIKGEKYEGGVSKGGILKLKPEFRTYKNGIENKSNIENWEDMTGGKFTGFKINATNAVVAAHGDYSNTGGMMIKDTMGGKLGMTFLTFLPMLLHGRWGAGVNLAAGTKRKKAVYKSTNTTIAALGAGIIAGAIFGPMIGIGVGVAAGLAKAKTKGKPTRRGKAIKRETGEISTEEISTGQGKDLALDYLNELLLVLKVYGANMLNIPTTILVGKKVIKLNPDKDFKGSLEDVKAMKAIMFEIAFITEFLLLKALAKTVLYCEEDTELCEKKTAAKNWLANNLNRALDDMMLPSNPLKVYNMVMKDGAFIRTVERISVWAYRYADYNEIDNIITSGEFVGESKLARAKNKVLLPSILKSTGIANINNATWWNPVGIMTKKSEWTEPQEMKKDFELGGDVIEDVFLKSDEKRADEIVKSRRAEYGVKLDRLNEKRKTKWTDYQITKKKNELYPTLTTIKNTYKKEYGRKWKKMFEKEIEKIVQSE